MRKLIDRVLSRYGTLAQVETAAGVREVKVFFRCVKSDAWQNVERMFSPLGEIPRGRYICLLPEDVAVEPEATLTVLGKQYLLRRVEKMAVFTEVVGQWCLCVEKGSLINGN